MATKPKKKAAAKPRRRTVVSLTRLSERDLEVPEGAAGGVKGGTRKLRPPLVPIPKR
jgi:hypothetical protein